MDHLKYTSPKSFVVGGGALLTLSNPIFLPTAYSPALIYCGQERGWWITCWLKSVLKTKTKKLNSVALVRERTILTEWPPPVGEVSANFLRIEGCHVVSATDPHGRFNLCFLDRSCYFLFK